MNYMEILEEWGKYSKYDSNQTRFNLLSVNYDYHKIGKMIETILKDYDDTGLLAVLYAKINFKTVLKQCKTDIWTVIDTPSVLDEEVQMYKLFEYPAVKEAEENFVNALNRIYGRITKDKLLGTSKEDLETLLPYLDTVLGQMHKLNTDLFAGDGSVGTIDHIDLSLHVFNTTAESVLAMEHAKDGIYFTFIKAQDTAECYFSFMIKSGTTIVSVNDRNDESFIGQHRCSRNGRWTEGKADEIFPYEYLFHYTEHDYKGYATSYKFNEGINLYNLGMEAFMPVIVAFILTIGKFQNKKLDLKLSFIDSLLPMNRQTLAESTQNVLMEIESSQISLRHNDVDTHFDTRMLINGDYTEQFEWRNDRNHKEVGSFTNAAQEMIDLWGQDFVLDESKFLPVCNANCLNKVTDKEKKEKEEYIPEYIGTEARIRKQLYKEARSQLAIHMQNKIYEEWIRIGKTEAIKSWYIQALRDNKENLYRIFMEYEERVLSGKEREVSMEWQNTNGYTINIVRDTHPSVSCSFTLYQDQLVNVKPKTSYRDDWIDEITGTKCNYWFVVRPNDAKDLKALCGCDIPKIVKGWKERRHCHGNSLLEATDATTEVRTPFEFDYREPPFWEEDDPNMKRWEGSHYNFRFAFGFSKRGWNQIKKELKNKQ